MMRMLAVEKRERHGHVEQCAHSFVPHDAGILGIGSVDTQPSSLVMILPPRGGKAYQPFLSTRLSRAPPAG
jgi:hypothetical protein